MKKAVFLFALFALFAILSHSAFARTQGITGGGAVGVPAELIMGVLAEENGGSGVTSMDDAVVTPSSTADEGTLSRYLYAGSGPVNSTIATATNTVTSTDGNAVLHCVYLGGCATTLPAASDTGFTSPFSTIIRNDTGSVSTVTSTSLIGNVYSLNLNPNAQIQPYSDSTKWHLAGASGDLFTYNRVFETIDPMTSLDSRLSMSNATTGSCSYADSSGDLAYTATGICAPRYDYDPSTLDYLGITIEENTGANAIANSMMIGATGTAGPTGWSFNAGGTGITKTVEGTATENGMTCLDVRFNGTPIATSEYQISFMPTPAVAVGTGVELTESMYIKLQAGATTNIVPKLEVPEYDNASWKTQNTGSALTVTSSLQQFTYTVTTVHADCDNIRPQIGFFVTNGAAVDATYRLCAPQIDMGAYASSFVPTYGTAVVRADDNLAEPSPYYLNNAEGTYCLTFMTRENQAGVVVADSAAARTLIGLTATSYGANDGTTAMDFNVAQIAAGTAQRVCVRWSDTASFANLAVNGTLGTQVAFDGDMDIGGDLSIFHDHANANRLNGWYQGAKSWDYALSDAAMLTESAAP